MREGAVCEIAGDDTETDVAQNLPWFGYPV